MIPSTIANHDKTTGSVVVGLKNQIHVIERVGEFGIVREVVNGGDLKRAEFNVKDAHVIDISRPGATQVGGIVANHERAARSGVEVGIGPSNLEHTVYVETGGLPPGSDPHGMAPDSVGDINSGRFDARRSAGPIHRVLILFAGHVPFAAIVMSHQGGPVVVKAVGTEPNRNRDGFSVAAVVVGSVGNGNVVGAIELDRLSEDARGIRVGVHERSVVSYDTGRG